MSTLLLIAERVLNRPLLITPDKAQVILSVLAGRIGVGVPEASRFEGDNIERDENGRPMLIENAWGDRVAKRKPYNVKNGVAIITITGSLVNRGAWIGANSGLTSYEGIGHQLKTAAEDPQVHAAVLDLHSPGGEAVGAFETAALVRSLASRKRTVAVVNGMAASAAYAIASGASEIVTTETGVSGSIGVVLLHADFSRNLDREGITPTLIHAGAHKVDGNPFEPLSAGVRDDLQAEVNAFYDAFLKTVAKGRDGRLTAANARKTEARTEIGQAAVAAGLADRVGSFESVLAELARAPGKSTTKPKGSSMDENEKPAPSATGITQAAFDSAVAAARTAGHAAGVDEERARFCAILDSEQAKGRGPAALAIARTGATLEQADAVLAATPAGNAPTAPRAGTQPLGLVAEPPTGAGAGRTDNPVKAIHQRLNAKR